VACAAVTALLVGYLVWCPWFHLDYDNFHGEVFSGAVTFDGLLFFVAIDPYTTLALPFYASAWAGNRLLLVRWSASQGDRRYCHASTPAERPE
jgi:hypothetical protein